MSLLRPFNKKLSGRLLGINAPYSLSFTGGQFHWESIPLLKQMALKNYPYLDHLLGITGSKEVESDVILRIYTYPATDHVNNILRDDNIINSHDRISLVGPLLDAFHIKLDNYQVVSTDHILIGSGEINALRIIGKSAEKLKDDSYEETVLVPTPETVLIFEKRRNGDKKRGNGDKSVILKNNVV